MALGLALALTGLLSASAAPAGAAGPAWAAAGRPSPAQGGDFAGRVELAGGRRLYLECRGTGRPTVILVSGYGNGADVWSLLDPGVRRPPVLAGVARYSRVCAYDRPNSILQPDGRSRSDPVPQPRTAADAVAELHALVRAARLRGPYVLVGHSLGGLFVRLYASTYPRQVAGLALVDATYELLRELFSPEQWAALARPRSSRCPASTLPWSCSTRTPASTRCCAPGRPGRCGQCCRWPSSPRPPGGAAARRAAGVSGCGHARGGVGDRPERAGPAPAHARHVIARPSGHYIQNAQPDLVIDAVRRVLRMVRPAAVRCRGDADSVARG